MTRSAPVFYPAHDDWVAEFQERAAPRLRKLFTSDRDFAVLPDTITEPLKRLALAEMARR